MEIYDGDPQSFDGHLIETVRSFKDSVSIPFAAILHKGDGPVIEDKVCDGMGNHVPITNGFKDGSETDGHVSDEEIIISCNSGEDPAMPVVEDSQHDEVKPTFHPCVDEFPLNPHICDCPTDASSICNSLREHSALEEFQEMISVISVTVKVLEYYLPDSTDTLLRNIPCYIDVFNKITDSLEDFFISDDISFHMLLITDHDLSLLKKLSTRILGK